MSDIKKIINDAWENKDQINPNSDRKIKDTINQIIADLDCGKVRARPVRIFGYSGLMGDGEEVELSEKSDNVWMHATAGTPNGVLLDVMCGGDEEK